MTRREHFEGDRLLGLSYNHLEEEAQRLWRANRKLRRVIRRLAAEKRDGGEFALTDPAGETEALSGRRIRKHPANRAPLGARLSAATTGPVCRRW